MADVGSNDPMRVIWKYPIMPADAFQIEMPDDAVILHVAEQDDAPHLWAIGTPGRPTVTRSFRLLGTGHLIPNEPLEYVGTCLQYGGSLVWHIFERRSE